MESLLFVKQTGTRPKTEGIKHEICKHVRANIEGLPWIKGTGSFEPGQKPVATKCVTHN